MAELYRWNDPLECLHQIFVGALDRLSSRKSGSRMKDDEIAEPLLDSELCQAGFHAVGNIKDLLIPACGNCDGD